jgi:hypothetical protein
MVLLFSTNNYLTIIIEKYMGCNMRNAIKFILAIIMLLLTMQSALSYLPNTRYQSSSGAWGTIVNICGGWQSDSSCEGCNDATATCSVPYDGWRIERHTCDGNTGIRCDESSPEVMHSGTFNINARECQTQQIDVFQADGYHNTVKDWVVWVGDCPDPSVQCASGDSISFVDSNGNTVQPELNQPFYIRVLSDEPYSWVVITVNGANQGGMDRLGTVGGKRYWDWYYTPANAQTYNIQFYMSAENDDPSKGVQCASSSFCISNLYCGDGIYSPETPYNEQCDPLYPPSLIGLVCGSQSGHPDKEGCLYQCDSTNGRYKICQSDCNYELQDMCTSTCGADAQCHTKNVGEECYSDSCSETYDDYCSGHRLVEYNVNWKKDSLTITDSCSTSCSDDCYCADCEVDCKAYSTTNHCVPGICDAECYSNSDCGPGGVCTNNCICEYPPTCGNNYLDSGEQCELPGTQNNNNCPQASTRCFGTKLGYRDARGDCADDCSCSYDDFTIKCAPGACYAQCDSDDDCGQDTCSETYDDYCAGQKLVDYNQNKAKDSATVTDSCDKSCKDDCMCTDCEPDCEAPSASTYCVKDVCGAQCDSDDDCPPTECDHLDGCVGNNYYDYSDMCNSCSGDCSCQSRSCEQPAIYWNDPRCTQCQQDNDCDHLDSTYCDGNLVKHDEGRCINYKCKTETITTHDCDEADQLFCEGTKVAFNDFVCSDANCVWSETLLIEECDDSLYCNGQETCENAACVAGTPADCSANNLCGIQTCSNNPDNQPMTWDYRQAFTSECEEQPSGYICTQGNSAITHECDTENCGAECEADSDCASTECDYLDGCRGRDYYDYQDKENNCLDSCTCESKGCTFPIIYEDDSRCLECQDDSDCSHLDSDYCQGDLVKQDRGICVGFQCETETRTVSNCNEQDRHVCDGNELKFEDYACSNAQCVWNDCTTVEYCDDGLYCNGQETCENAACMAGTPADCGGNNLCGIQTCSNNPDNQPMTWDYRQAFTSECEEQPSGYICTQGDSAITHTCDKENCGAECEADSDCASTECDYLDGCRGRDYYDYHDTHNTCLDSCSCEENNCISPTILEDDPRCTECQDDIDCNHLDKDYCEADLIRHDEGRCINYQCEVETTTTAQCDDGLYCNGLEKCENAQCIQGTPVDCSTHDIGSISTCDAMPDNNGLTWDYREQFQSQCTEQSTGYTCTEGDNSIKNDCDKERCMAECETGYDCAATDCDHLDGCHGNDYYDYNDVKNQCEDWCTCETNTCGEPSVSQNDPRCTECLQDSDCSYLTRDYCNSDLVMHDTGRCIDYQCEAVTDMVSSCNDQDRHVCDNTEIKFEDYTCSDAQCTLADCITVEYCDDGLYCNGQETCENAACIAGTPADCSSYNINSVASCTSSPDSNPATWDYRQEFTSECVEEESWYSCTQGDSTIAHTCDKQNCEAGCASDQDCGQYGSCASDCKCVYQPYCGDGTLDDQEQCELPGTQDNTFCSQHTTQCFGNKLGIRDGYGNCNSQCSCAEDQFTFQCVAGECGAQCSESEQASQPCGQSAIGECELGIQRRICGADCMWGGWSECSGDTYGTEEICDEKDNDCDGAIDEGFDLQTDNENCGACGVLCLEYQACIEGKCEDQWCDYNYVKYPRRKIHLDRIAFVHDEFVGAGEELRVVVNLKNSGVCEMAALEMKASVPSLGIRSARLGPVKVAADGEITRELILEIPEKAWPGFHIMRLEVYNQGIRRIKHRPLIVY